MPPATDHRRQLRRGREQVRADIVAAATDLLRTRSFAELTVHDVMAEVGQGRTVFYRHFDDLGDLLRRAAREPAESLLEAQHLLAETRPTDPLEAIREGIAPVVHVYVRHGPVLRAVGEAAATDPLVARNYAELRDRFEDIAEQGLRDVTGLEDLRQTARALHLMNEAYLVDAFGREPRVSPETAMQTLSEIWAAVARPGGRA